MPDERLEGMVRARAREGYMVEMAGENWVVLSKGKPTPHCLFAGAAASCFLVGLIGMLIAESAALNDPSAELTLPGALFIILFIFGTAIAVGAWIFHAVVNRAKRIMIEVSPTGYMVERPIQKALPPGYSSREF